MIERAGWDFGETAIDCSNIFFVRLIGMGSWTDTGAVECSSTNVRNALQTGNVEMVHTICSQSVAEYLLRHSSDLY